MPTEGIRGIDPIDHRFAERFGFVIKHLAIGRDRGEGVELRVHPALVQRDTPLANVERRAQRDRARRAGARSDACSRARGAGDMPTAVSVVADVLDVARARRSGFAGLATRGIQMQARPLTSRRRGARRATTCASRCTTARASWRAWRARSARRASRSSRWCRRAAAGRAALPVEIVMLTHEASERDVRRALEAIAGSGVAASAPRLLRIQE